MLDTKHKSSGSTVCSCQHHVVFCPKRRRPVLVDGADERLKEVALETTGRFEGAEVLEMEVMPHDATSASSLSKKAGGESCAHYRTVASLSTLGDG